MRPRAHGERTVLRRERELDVIGRKQAHEVHQQPARHDDGALALHLRGNDRAQRQLHVRRGEPQHAGFGAQLDAGENLHRAASRYRAGHDAEPGGEILACAGDEQLAGETGFCVCFCFHYLLTSFIDVVRSVDDGEDGPNPPCKQGFRLWGNA